MAGIVCDVCLSRLPDGVGQCPIVVGPRKVVQHDRQNGADDGRDHKGDEPQCDGRNRWTPVFFICNASDDASYYAADHNDQDDGPPNVVCCDGHGCGEHNVALLLIRRNSETTCVVSVFFCKSLDEIAPSSRTV